jgi:hypothetical protein
VYSLRKGLVFLSLFKVEKYKSSQKKTKKKNIKENCMLLNMTKFFFLREIEKRNLIYDALKVFKFKEKLGFIL